MSTAREKIISTKLPILLYMIGELDYQVTSSSHYVRPMTAEVIARMIHPSKKAKNNFIRFVDMPHRGRIAVIRR